MQSDEERVRFGSSFDAVAEDYAAARPRYPQALFDDVDRLVGPPPGVVLEIGCGPGTATEDLLERGWRVVAIEPGVHMAELARRRLDGQTFEVVVSSFENWNPGQQRYDVVFSATAFHWVEPAVRWTKSAAVLRPGGHVALATNRTVGGSSFDHLHRAAEPLQRSLGVDMGEAASPPETDLATGLRGASHDIGAVWGVADPKGGSLSAGGLFDAPTVQTYVWEQDYTTDEAVALLSTYSPYLAIPEPRRAALFAGIAAMIDDSFGGSVTRRYLSILAVARCRQGDET